MFELHLEAERKLFTIHNVSSTIKVELWTLSVDGSSNSRRSGVGVVLISPKRGVIERAICSDFKTTSNEAEYESLIADLSLEKDLGSRASWLKVIHS